MPDIYTRGNQVGKVRGGVSFNPPPGYDGNAFADDMNIKLHEASDELPQIERKPPPEIIAEPVIKDRTEFENTAEKSVQLPNAEPPQSSDKGRRDGLQTLDDLFGKLRGRIGREELIIILVMLLVASDGLSPELLILALILTAG